MKNIFIGTDLISIQLRIISKFDLNNTYELFRFVRVEILQQKSISILMLVRRLVLPNPSFHMSANVYCFVLEAMLGAMKGFTWSSGGRQPFPVIEIFTHPLKGYHCDPVDTHKLISQEWDANMSGEVVSMLWGIFFNPLSPFTSAFWRGLRRRNLCHYKVIMQCSTWHRTI